MTQRGARARQVRRGTRRGAQALCALLLGVGLSACGGAPEVQPEPSAQAQPARTGQGRPGPNAQHVLSEGAKLDLLKARCDDAVAGAQAARALIYEAPTTVPTEVVLQHFNQLFVALEDAEGLAAVLGAMAPEGAVRDAAEACEQTLAKITSEVGLDVRLYERLRGVEAGAAALDPASKRFYEKLTRDFVRAGVDRDEQTRARLAEINARSVELGQRFSRAVREDRRTVKVDAKLLAGLPEDWLAAHPADEQGQITVSTDYPDYFPVQTYAADEALRRELTVAFLNKGYPQNEQTLKELLVLRHEYANLIGYANWADYTAQDKMVGSEANAQRFIDELNEIVRPVSDADVALLLERKRKDNPEAKHIEAWDRAYYPNRVRAEQFAFDSQSVRPYFPFEAVKKGLFEVYSELFHLEFKVLPEMEVWHENVEGWGIFEDGQEIGRFYLDLHPREGKYGHAAVFPMITGLTGEGGTKKRYPLATLVCNFPQPTYDEAGQVVSPGLMQHNEVVTLFHEFGHLIHHLLAGKSAWLSLGGISVEWDFAEVPSQLLEEWAWDPAVLARFAQHVETGEAIPAALVQKMRTAEEFGKGAFNQRQIHLAAYSHFLHTLAPEQIDLDAFTREIYARYSPFPAIEGAHDYASFGHLVGYSSMYYTYQWSLGIAKDLFTRFQKEGLMAKKPAQDYRTMILEIGGGQDAAKMVEQFLGRPYNLDAYRAWMRAGQGE